MIRIQRSGIQTFQGQIDYLWFDILDPVVGKQYFRAVALAELASVPVSAREDYDLLQKQWAAVRGLYNAKADYVYTAAGIFTPQHVGVVQFYGGAGEAESREQAAELARRNLAAVKATLANYAQSRLASPTPAWVEWYLDFVTRRSQNILALLGHPDPRETRRGLGKDGEIANNTGDDLAAEQNELLFRGLAKLRQDFVFQVTSRRKSRVWLAEGLAHVARIAGNLASRQRGSVSIGFNLSIPIAMALSSASSGGRSSSISNAQSQAEGVSQGWGQAHTESTSHTESVSHTVGGSETHTVGTGSSQSTGHTESVGQTNSQSHTDSQSHSDTWSHTDSRSHSESQGVTQSESTSIGHSTSQGTSSNWSAGGSTSWSESTSTGHSEGVSSGQSESESSNWGSGESSNWSSGESSNWSQGSSDSASQSASQTTSDSLGGSVSGGVPGVVQGSVTGTHTEGSSATSGTGHTDSSSTGGGTSSSTGGGTSTSQGGGTTTGVSSGASSSDSWSTTSSSGGSSSSSRGGGSFSSTSDSVTQSSGTATSRGSADTWGTADSKGGADTRGSADSVGTATSRGSADSTGSATSQSESRSTSSSWAVSRGSADSWGKADSTSQNWGRSHTEGETQGQALSRAVSSGYSGGFSSGLVPGISINRSWQVEDDLLMRLTEIVRQYEALLNQASAEGAFLTSAVIFTADQTGATAAQALVPQAFHGPNVPMPVFTIQPQGADATEFRDHALAFLPCTGAEEKDLLGGYTGSGYATLLPPGQNAAYTAPALFEEGTASTVMSPIPRGMGFYPVMPGDVLIGHQYSPETADLTTAPVRMDERRMMHTMFAGDTGWGKSVAAIMMAYESTLRWKTRTVVLDFGAGWRQLLNAPGLQGHVDILQLWPDAVRPFRWNPLQIGRQINPETQWRAFADIFGSIAKLGVRRQKQELLQALRNIYVRAGVLVDDPVVRNDPEWGNVRGDQEAAIAQATPGKPLGKLRPEQRQALAVFRSSGIGLADLSDEVQRKLDGIPPRDTMLSGVLEGILFRLNPLVQGAASQQFAAGKNTTPLEDLSRPWGITIIEGGIFLDDFGKAFLLGWAGWHLYTDMVARRVHEISGSEPLLQIYFEEANKIFGGAGDGGGDDESGGVSTSQRFGDMFRDARKYGCRLHVVTQAPSLIPQDIISSCNNLVIGFLKNPKDKDIVLSALARSERGFHDEEWRRFLTNENIGMAIGRFPYTDSRELQQPLLFKPLMLSVPEPTDAEIEQRLGKVNA